jgi:hypothetical protein
MYYAARVRYHLNGTTHLILVREVCSPLRLLRCGSAPVGDTSLDMVVLHKVASERSTVAGVLEGVMQEQVQAISVLTKACRSAAY